MSNQQLRELVELMLAKQYIEPHEKDGYKFTDTFWKQYNTLELDKNPLRVLSSTETSIQKRMLPVDWELRFMAFIADAKVPARIENSRGQAYFANKYSEKALKVFQKAIEGGVDYDLLVKSTTLYYKGNINFKKTVGNYFIDGDWRSDFIALRDLIQEGNPEALVQHIKTETDEGERSQYKFG